MLRAAARRLNSRSSASLRGRPVVLRSMPRRACRSERGSRQGRPTSGTRDRPLARASRPRHDLYPLTLASGRSRTRGRGGEKLEADRMEVPEVRAEAMLRAPPS